MSRFDITRYVDKGARTEKVCMVAPGVQADDVTIVMKGNSEGHPNAYIIFRLFADTIKTMAEPSPTLLKKQSSQPEAALGLQTSAQRDALE